MHDLGIVILNWNTRDFLKRCLETVLASQGDFTYRVIVADNASTDDSAALVRKTFPNVELIVSDINGGFSYGNNLGLRALGYHGVGNVEADAPRYVLLLNPDTEVPPDALYNLTVSFFRFVQTVSHQPALWAV
jgi:GT2 family glycosyltransferase